MGDKGHEVVPLTPGAQPEPSWWAVVRTTLRLWLERHDVANGTPGNRRRLTVIAAVAACVVVAIVVTVVLVLPGSAPAAPVAAAVVQASPVTSAQAATWVAQQVSPAAIVSCDPVMCSVLRAHGVPSSQLLVLRAGGNPLGSAVVVATPVLRGQYGARLSSVDAPELIASFGSGAARIDILAVLPAGGQSFRNVEAGDRELRIAAAGQLLREPRISLSAAARAALTAGDVDPRLLVALAGLAGRVSIGIVTFGDPSPGAADVPLRSAEISADSAAGLRSMISFLRAQPAQVSVIQKNTLSVEYDAPGPLGFPG
jgi:hypothetical protein